jgi:acyl-CoA thioesterase FadM
LIKVLSGKSKESWLDTNDHVNIRFYTELLDESLSELVRLPNSINVFLEKNVTFVVARFITVHIREMKSFQNWIMKAGVYELSQTGFKTIHELYVDNQRITKFYVWSRFFNLDTRTSVKVSADKKIDFLLPIIKEIEDPFNKF